MATIPSFEEEREIRRKHIEEQKRMMKMLMETDPKFRAEVEKEREEMKRLKNAPIWEVAEHDWKVEAEYRKSTIVYDDF